MLRRSVTFQKDLLESATKIAKKRGFASVNALIVHALEREVNGAQPAFDQMESRIAALLDRMLNELRKVNRQQQINLAFTDCLAKYLFQCITEPSKEEREASRARAALRHDKYLKAIAGSLQGDFKKALKSLLSTDEAAETK
jgi:hypothetical protein